MPFIFQAVRQAGHTQASTLSQYTLYIEENQTIQFCILYYDNCKHFLNILYIHIEKQTIQFCILRQL